MSYANKPNRPDSREVAKLRAEYEKKAQEVRDTRDPASIAKLRDDKAKLFQKVVAQVNGERAEQLVETQKVYKQMGRYRSDEQMAEEQAKLQGKPS